MSTTSVDTITHITLAERCKEAKPGEQLIIDVGTKTVGMIIHNARQTHGLELLSLREASHTLSQSPFTVTLPLSTVYFFGNLEPGSYQHALTLLLHQQGVQEGRVCPLKPFIQETLPPGYTIEARVDRAEGTAAIYVMNDQGLHPQHGELPFKLGDIL